MFTFNVYKPAKKTEVKANSVKPVDAIKTVAPIVEPVKPVEVPKETPVAVEAEVPVEITEPKATKRTAAKK